MWRDVPSNINYLQTIEALQCFFLFILQQKINKIATLSFSGAVLTFCCCFLVLLIYLDGFQQHLSLDLKKANTEPLLSASGYVSRQPTPRPATFAPTNVLIRLASAQKQLKILHLHRRQAFGAERDPPAPAISSNQCYLPLFLS